MVSEWLQDETKDIASLADYLRHTSLDAARRYAWRSDNRVKKTVVAWLVSRGYCS